MKGFHRSNSTQAFHSSRTTSVHILPERGLSYPFLHRLYKDKDGRVWETVKINVLTIFLAPYPRDAKAELTPIDSLEAFYRDYSYEGKTPGLKEQYAEVDNVSKG